MSDKAKTQITQDKLDSMLPEIRNAIKEESGLTDNAALIIDPILATLLPHVFEVVEEGGEEISIEDVRQEIRDFIQSVENADNGSEGSDEEAAVASEEGLPVVSLRVASTNERKGIAHVTVQLETGPLQEDLFVQVLASGGSSGTVFRRINAGKTESHPITIATGRNITLSIVEFADVEMPKEIRKKMKAPKELTPYTIINQEESEESADE